MFLVECKYIVKEKKMKYITDNRKISSDESDEEFSHKVFDVKISLILLVL